MLKRATLAIKQVTPTCADPLLDIDLADIQIASGFPKWLTCVPREWGSGDGRSA